MILLLSSFTTFIAGGFKRTSFVETDVCVCVYKIALTQTDTCAHTVMYTKEVHM